MAKANSMKQTSEEEYYSLDSFWRDYFKHYEVASKGRVKGVGNIDNEIGLLQQMDCFRSNAIKIVKNYIDEMLSGFEPERIMNGQYSYYQGLWLRTGGKELNLLFLVNYYLNDIVYSLGDIRNISLRVPPMALVKYKGFKVLCICNLPFSVFEKT